MFRVYNRCVDDHSLPNPAAKHDEEYLRRRRILLNRYKNAVNEKGRAERCTGCNKCSPKCPQGLNIPQQLGRVEKLVEAVRNEWQ